MATITSSDLLNPNKSDRNKVLFSQHGMDAGGNNEVGAWLRRLAQSAGQTAAGGFALQGELEPQREAAIRGLFELLNPANMVKNAQTQGQGMISGARDAGARNAAQIGQLGGNQGAMLGAVNQAQNQGTNASNQLLLNAQSPGAQTDALMKQLQVFQQAIGPGFEQLLQMFNPIEQRSATNAAQKAQGGFSGILSSLAGSILPSLIPGGGMMSGLMSGGAKGGSATSGAPDWYHALF